ncbi:hypothetical protein GCM10028807_10440 [Spirosoma daeguense]
MGKQSSQYDKIVKENIEAVIPSLMQHILAITAIVSEELPDDIQHTKERKPDVLKKITDDLHNTFVLQIEFQVADEHKMIYRMAEYYVMLERKYELPIRQFVIFLGSSVPEMPTQLDSAYMKFHFPLISFAQLDYQLFLQSPQPEEVVLSILGNFKNQNPERVLKEIIQRVEETTEGDLALKKYFNQLRVLAQLRNLELILKTAMDSIAKHINEERDVLFLRGIDQGFNLGEEKIVASLLTKLNYSLEQIAEIAGVSVDFVKKVKQKISANQ